MKKFNIKKWVEAEPRHRQFRQAVHTILVAISGTSDLQTTMIMKGGVLLALGYESPRFTKDIDFSTSRRLSEFSLESFRTTLEKSLIETVEAMGYGLDCRVQTCRQEPPRDDATFPTISVTIGYAYKHETAAHKRLIAKNAPSIVSLDYSLNEPIGTTDFLELDDGANIRTYSLADLVAEKFRALLQQGQRNRIRRQDIYDLHYILATHPTIMQQHAKEQILSSLLEKSHARALTITSDSMANPEIIRRAREEYPMLASEIEGALPPFEQTYKIVQDYYRSLPWNKEKSS